MPTLRDFLHQAREQLTAAGVPEPRLEAEIMLTDTLRVPRHRLYAFQDDDLSTEVERTLEEVMERRLKREPLAYILGHREFYGIDLLVGPAVMVPRPETELLVERAMLVCMERMDKGRLVVADVGTGSGGIAINLAIHIPQAKIFATDLSRDALEVARANVLKYKVGERVTLVPGDLLDPITGTIDVIVANLPYIPTQRLAVLQPEVRWEPPAALDGGTDGLDLLRRLMGQAVSKLPDDGVVLLEIDPGQAEPLRRLAQELFPGANVSVEQDLAGHDRIFVLERSGQG